MLMVLSSLMPSTSHMRSNSWSTRNIFFYKYFIYSCLCVSFCSNISKLSAWSGQNENNVINVYVIHVIKTLVSSGTHLERGTHNYNHFQPCDLDLWPCGPKKTATPGWESKAKGSGILVMVSAILAARHRTFVLFFSYAQ